MDKIVFGSNNRDKWLELVDDFKDQDIELILSEKHLELEEDEQTLRSNSYTKAKSAAIQTGLMAIGDDSGVFITSWDYWPGVHSRRWMEGTDRDRNVKIIEMMKGIEDREIFLISRFVLVDPTGDELFSTVTKNRFIVAEDINGNSGFGYDPILIPSHEMLVDAVERKAISQERAEEIEKNKITIGSLTQHEKNAINNRGRIAKEIREFLNNRGV